MAGVPTPQIITEAFGLNADAGTITLPVPLTTGVSGAASFDKGFGSVNMTPIDAGGVPPFGQDVNGILYMISSHCAALQAGQPYVYNSAVATAIGGYALGTVLGMGDGGGLWFNTISGNTTNPDDDVSAAGWVTLYRYGYETINSTGGTVTLAPSQSRSPVIVINGTLTSNLAVIFPATKQTWLIVNATSGAFAVTCRLVASAGVQIAQGGYAQPTGVYGNGSEIYASFVPPAALPTSVAPNPSTIALRSNAGYLYATYFNQSSLSNENPPVGSLFVETGGDGFFRKIQLAAFIGQIFTGSFGPSGWRKLPDGTIIQWGQLRNNSHYTNGTTWTINFPTTFPTQVGAVIAVANGTIGTTGYGNGNAYASTTPLNTSQFQLGLRDVANEGYAGNADWFAIGN